MRPDRRRLLQLTGAGLALTAAATSHAAPPAPAPLLANNPDDQTAGLQAAIDDAAARLVPLVLPAGTFRSASLTLRPGSVITGAGDLTTLVMTGEGPLISARSAARIHLRDLTLDGALQGSGPADHAAMAVFDGCPGLELSAVTIRNGTRNGLAVTGSSGRICACTFTALGDAAIFALDSVLMVTGNAISACGNNGIQVWRTLPGEDGSIVSGNRISGIRADGGASGQNGNGINVFRAGSVQVSNNRIIDCAYSAIRGNAASNLLVTANTCQRLGEVAIYAEFGFSGALIANNLIDGAACGVSVTNFNEGGRLAVVQGNLIRNIVRREHEPVDKRGEGIAAEADTLVTGNTIENAATCGILLGTGRYMRDVTATGNLIRGSTIGVLISADKAAGSAVVSGNTISGAKDGAIRAHDQGRAFGTDLARAPATTGRVTISGNSAV